MNARPLIVLVAISVLGFAGCASDTKAESSTKVHVVATTTQLADFSRVVGGDDVEVYGLLRTNVDPHDYEPSPADIEQLRTADVIVENGVGLEKWFGDVIKAAGPTGQVVDASKGVRLRKGDPHIWHNPKNAEVMVRTIEAALAKAEPSGATQFRRRTTAYIAELEELDALIARKIAALPNKRLVTNHDAFGYFIDRYGLEFVGSIVPSFDTSAELSARDVADIVAKIKATGVKAVFSETSMPGRTAESIGKEAGVKVVAGDRALYGDTLGPKGSDADTYLKMMWHNASVIVDNLS
jgi:zinc/manganese transport system substrate-binding protein/manganese/iron transport system substrate-binding protein